MSVCLTAMALRTHILPEPAQGDQVSETPQGKGKTGLTKGLNFPDR